MNFSHEGMIAITFVITFPSLFLCGMILKRIRPPFFDLIWPAGWVGIIPSGLLKGRRRRP